MQQILKHEVKFVRYQRKADTSNGRMENVILSLAYMENAYRNRFPKGEKSFSQWLTTWSNAKWSVKQWYIAELLRSLSGWKKVDGHNKCKDAYYADKLLKGLITPFTEEDLKKRSYSPKLADSKSDESGAPRMILQGNDLVNSYESWFDNITKQRDVSRQRGVNEQIVVDPLDTYLIKEAIAEERESKINLFMANNFKPHEIDIALEYLHRSKGVRRGLQKEMLEDLSISRGQLQYLIKKVNKLLKESNSDESFDFYAIRLLQEAI